MDIINAEFLKATWDITGPEVTQAVQEFFRNGQMLKQWNYTVITLIPKKVNADKISEVSGLSLSAMSYTR